MNHIVRRYIVELDHVVEGRGHQTRARAIETQRRDGLLVMRKFVNKACTAQQIPDFESRVTCHEQTRKKHGKRAYDLTEQDEV